MAGMMSKLEFKQRLEPTIERLRRKQHLTESGAMAIRQKGDQLMDLFAELDKRGLLKSPDEIDFQSIGNVLKNFDEVNILNATFLRLYKECKGQERPRTHVPIHDSNGAQYSISVKQFVILWGWAYCALCEVVKTMMTELVRFPAKPAGIGEVMLALERCGGLDLSYFDFVEPRVRNAFFHLDFRLNGGEIAIAGRREPLKVADLVESTIRIDAIIFPLMTMIRSCIDR